MLYSYTIIATDIKYGVDLVEFSETHMKEPKPGFKLEYPFQNIKFTTVLIVFKLNLLQW